MVSLDYLASAEWNEMLGKVLACEGRAKAEALFDCFQQVLHADELMLFYIRDGAGPSIMAHRSCGAVSADQLQEYTRSFYLADPFYLAIEEVAKNQLMTLREVAEREEFETSDFYIQHYGHTDLVDELCYCITDGKGGFVLLSFARSARMSSYSAADIAVARRLAPVMIGCLSSTWTYLANAVGINAPTLEEMQEHQDLKKARDNFGRAVLTDREFQVVQMMLRGYPIDLISSRLKMAEGTTKVHRRNIYRKLDINSKAELFSLFLDVVGEVKVVGDEDPLHQYNQS